MIPWWGWLWALVAGLLVCWLVNVAFFEERGE